MALKSGSRLGPALDIASPICGATTNSPPNSSPGSTGSSPCSSAGSSAPIRGRSPSRTWITTWTSSPFGSTGARLDTEAHSFSVSRSRPWPSRPCPTDASSNTSVLATAPTTRGWGHPSQVDSQHSRYSRSSRLASRAPRPSRCDAALAPRAASVKSGGLKGDRSLVWLAKPSRASGRFTYTYDLR